MAQDDWNEILRGAFEFSNFDQSAKVWKTDDGKWYSQSPADLQALHKMIENLNEKSRLGIVCQCLIWTRGLDVIKSLLFCPSKNTNERPTNRLTWNLLFNLVQGNPEIKRRIWNECGKLLMDYMEDNLPDNDLCCMVLHSIYVLGRVCENEGTKILKILLNSFDLKKQDMPLKKQELTMFLEHFISDEKDIGAMYRTLNGTEKVTLVQFVVDHINREPAEKDNVYHSYPLSNDLLSAICIDFVAKSDEIFQTSTKEKTDVRELFALFECIAHVSKDKDYALHTNDFELLRNIRQLNQWVSLNGDDADRVFPVIRRSSNEPLAQLLLTTISNLVGDNSDHNEMATESGII